MYKNKNINIFSHLLVWLVLFSMPYFLSYGQEQDIDRIAARFWVPLAFYALIFYLNYFIFIDKFLFAKKTIQFIIINIVCIALFLALKEQIGATFFDALLQRDNRKEEGKPPIEMFIYMQALSYIAPLLFSIALKTTKRWVTTEAERKEAANVKLQSELQHLRYQLQPHFFFNSLNNIYSLVDISPEQAKSTIHSLSKLMRYLLYETNIEMVPITKEIDFMKKYLELMKLRVSDKTQVVSQFPSGLQTIQIAPLLFISLIENAFKHGVSANKESHIKIDMTTEDKTVRFTIENDNFPKQTTDKSGSGIGLQNLKKRLELLYPDKHVFKTEVKDGQFLVDLQIET
ncbi:sensor histidine kinase [Formosa sp. PL04]|uniref:sensor histidine kinase n=1 Tax=Formosa sp. PL04 TaxID=3081755 RepID=UPI002980B1AF|nr:histidine kinase [Formosa sp. PL04]MDW5288520.1 histidine kinase [Formosa sp. PL04]